MSKRISAQYFLDKDNCIELYFWFVLGKNSLVVKEFVIILFLVVENKKFEVIKYDFSHREKLHVHKYYLNKKTKEFLNIIIEPKTIVFLKEGILNNWGEYVLLFKQNNYI